MIRGIRGATTVHRNDGDEIIAETEKLVLQMIEANQLVPEQVASVLLSVTDDLNAAFPAKALRTIEGWAHVPVMCMREIPVPDSLPKCIRVMMTVNVDIPQKEVKHIYLREAVSLRPDFSLTRDENS
ncbi:chorismate mutase [Bacillus songklensis]|uniref:chorismate mutase n=1 Tax=Bacillus songklensis TaxID=1069116 RepID=A0ABV8B0G5_9BACI